ncbi:MAG: universal stress protein [Thermodesulfobacteria bacterium]|nr:universal stress protein [Thermodesulfobacteriota bacterium]
MAWQIQKILFPYDGSEDSALALEPALHLAQKEGAEVLCLYVIHLPTIWATPIDISREDLVESLKPEAERVLNEVAQKFEAAGVKTRKIIREGSPVSEIVRTASEEDVDLIVMSSHGSHSTKDYLGSVTRGVLDRTNKTVLIVKPPELPDPFAVP